MDMHHAKTCFWLALRTGCMIIGVMATTLELRLFFRRAVQNEYEGYWFFTLDMLFAALAVLLLMEVLQEKPFELKPWIWPGAYTFQAASALLLLIVGVYAFFKHRREVSRLTMFLILYLVLMGYCYRVT